MTREGIESVGWTLPEKYPPPPVEDSNGSRGRVKKLQISKYPLQNPSAFRYGQNTQK